MKTARRSTFVTIMWLALAALAIGAIANCAAVLVISYHPGPYDTAGETFISATTGPLWIYQERHARGSTRLDATAASQWAIGRSSSIPVREAPSWSALRQPPGEGEETREIIEEGFGWPFPAFGCEWNKRTIRGMSWLTPVHAIQLSKPNPHDRLQKLVIPLRPLWFGIAINTLLLALMAVPGVMLIGFAARGLRTFRARRRRRRGRCPQCGYNLQGKLDDGCSECGWNREQ